MINFDLLFYVRFIINCFWLMEERDYYLQQQTEKLGEKLNSMSSYIAEFTDEEKINKGFDLVNQDLLEYLNLDLDEIINIQLDHFIATITVDSIMDNVNLDSFANLLFHIAKAYSILEDKETAKRLFHRSLIVYKFLLKIETDFPYERHLRIQELSEILLK
jgi:hypothetical protein